MPRKANENKLKKDLKNGIMDSTEVMSSEVKVPKSTSKTSKSSASKATSKTTAKRSSSKTTSKKSTSTKASNATKKAVSKRSTSKNVSTSADKKSSVKKSTSKTSKTSFKKSLKRKLNGKKAISPNLKKMPKFIPVSLEYYDLPYRYNKTVVKALAQNPTTLFVYWEISDEDRQNFINQYGEDFFYITKPVLTIHNLTDKYSYEIDINDFANNWYIHVNNAKCQYVIELGRKPICYTEKVPTDYISITSSNVIESPNDHVLFFDNTTEIYFKNIHTNQYTKRVIKPFLKHVYGIYKNFNLSEDINRFDFKNPSSQNPTSNVL